MAIVCLGSINLDRVYRVDHAPAAGETLAAEGYDVHLGGKGANQAIAAARAGARVRLVGAVGPDGAWARDRLAAAGIDVEGVAVREAASGHAVILVEPSGENRIVIHPGANRGLGADDVERALATARPGDWLLTQNETSAVAEAMAAARARGLRTAHAAAPFVAGDCAAVLDHTDLLALNAVEARALADRLGAAPEALPVGLALVTHGRAGASLYAEGREIRVEGHAVEAVDTTGAGDCLLGVLLAALDEGMEPAAALALANAAAAVSVTRAGAGEAAPTRAEAEAMLRGDGR
ncbi:MAG: PfkB family carbohydrate kinase [Paracoccaceae bacterium]